MSGSITVSLTDRECRVLAELSNELDLPQDRVMVMALRVYQKHLHPVADLAMVKSYVDPACTCPTIDGVQVTGSACPVHGLEEVDL